MGEGDLRSGAVAAGALVDERHDDAATLGEDRRNGADASRPPNRRLRDVARLATAVGALVLLVSLWFQWAVNRDVQPAVPLTGWQNYVGTDLALAALALVGLGAALVRQRWAALVSLGAGGLAALWVLRLISISDPGRGAQVALLGGVLVAGASAFRLSQRDAAAPTRFSASTVALASTVLIAGPIALFNWPISNWVVSLGADDAWIGGLHMAFTQGLNFGSQLVFTYGPLGFLTVPRIAYTTPALLSFAYAGIVYFLLAAAFLTRTRQELPLLGAAVLTFLLVVIFRLSGPIENFQVAVVTIAFIGAMAVLRQHRDLPSRRYLLLTAAAGVVAGAEVLMKFNTGLMLLGITGVAVAVARPARWALVLAVYGGSVVVSLLALWLATGQVLGDLPEYFSGSFHIASSYSEAMLEDPPSRGWERMAAALVTGLVAYVGWRQTQGWRRLRRVAALGLLAVFLFAWFKQGFVRHELNSTFFFASAIGAIVAFGFSRIGRPLGVVAIAAVTLAFLGASQPPPFRTGLIPPRVAMINQQFEDLLQTDVVAATSRTSMRENSAPIDPETMSFLRGRTVHVWPQDASLAYGYPEFTWKPLPVLQGYPVYGAELDQINADFIRSDEAPERIIMSTDPKLFRPFEQPSTKVAMFCRYVELRSVSDGKVLGRVPNRCGQPQPAGTVRTTTGQPVAIPQAGEREIVYASVQGLGVQGIERLRAFLWKAFPRNIMLDGDPWSRIAPGVAEGQLLLNASQWADYSGRYYMTSNPKSMTAFIGNIESPQVKPIRVDFFRVPVTRPGVAAEGAGEAQAAAG